MRETITYKMSFLLTYCTGPWLFTDTMAVVIKLCVAFAMLNMLKGLKIAPSTGPVFGKFYNAMSNLTISCSEENLIHLDWHKDTSDLSSCSANAEPYCLPGDRYTYENGSFNMMLINMKSGDCGRYICKTYTGSKSFDLHLIDHVKALDIVENSHSITLKTNCVYPSYTVKIQWFYIYEDGLPTSYNKPASRSEERGNCTGTCWGNTALQISSTLELPTGAKNPIQVKLMMYVEQGGEIMKKTSTKLYTIERCLPPRKDGFIIVMCLAIVFILVDIIYINRQQRESSTVNTERHGADQRKSGNEERNSEETQVSTSGALYQQACTDAILVILVSCVIVICSIILMMLKHETKIPDLDGNCSDDVHATNTTSVIVIAFGIIAIMVHWKLIVWANRNVISILRNRNKNKTVDGENGEMQNLTIGDNSSSDREEPGCSRNVEVKTTNSEIVKGTEELKGTSEELFQLETTHCNQSLTCLPSSVNEVLINIGGSAKLTCNLDLKNFHYPSWQAPDGKVINYGGQEKVEEEFKGYIKWGTDKTSIVISEVNVSHAGMYVCFSPDGKVQTLTLVVALPTKKIEVSENKTVHLDPDLMSTRPAWRRLTNIVPEQFNTVHDERIEIRDDKKSILIKNCKIQDTGFYEVVGNNVTQRFELLVKKEEYTDRAYTIDQGSTIRLHSSSKEEYPSWECFGKGVFNYGGEENFRLKESNRFLWSVDKKSLMIVGILIQDTGTYICRHANGFVETVTIIVKGKPHLVQYVKGKEKDIFIPHNTGYLLPSVVRTDESGIVAICHQNYQSTGLKTERMNQKNNCHLSVHATSIPSLLEFSAYHRPIHTFQVKTV